MWKALVSLVAIGVLFLGPQIGRTANIGAERAIRVAPFTGKIPIRRCTPLNPTNQAQVTKLVKCLNANMRQLNRVVNHCMVMYAMTRYFGVNHADKMLDYRRVNGDPFRWFVTFRKDCVA